MAKAKDRKTRSVDFWTFLSLVFSGETEQPKTKRKQAKQAKRKQAKRKAPKRQQPKVAPKRKAPKRKASPKRQQPKRKPPNVRPAPLPVVPEPAPGILGPATPAEAQVTRFPNTPEGRAAAQVLIDSLPPGSNVAVSVVVEDEPGKFRMLDIRPETLGGMGAQRNVWARKGANLYIGSNDNPRLENVFGLLELAYGRAGEEDDSDPDIPGGKPNTIEVVIWST